MNIIVIGGTGYLGSRLIKRLVTNDHNVLCIKREYSSTKNLNTVLDKIHFVNSNDIEIAAKISDCSPEVVVNTACTYERQGILRSEVLESNFVFPFRILEYTLQAGIKRWINTDTALPEDMNIYSATKHQFSELGKLFSEVYNIDFINLKLEHFYGENEPDAHFLSWVIQKLRNNEPLNLTEGTQKRDFVYVEDVENIIVSMLTFNISGFQSIPVGTGIAPTIREVIDYLHEITNSSSILNFGAVPLRENEPSSDCNTSILKRFNLECSTNWKDGMKKIIGDVK